MSHLYQINVHVETLEEWCGTLDMDPTDIADFKARTHSRIIIAHAPPGPPDGRTPQQLLDSYRWAAGLIARLTLHLQWQMIRQGAVKHHGCAGEWTHCGRLYEEGIIDPRTASAEYPPYVELDVIPTDAQPLWVPLIQRSLANVIAADQQPAAPSDLAPDHEPATLFENPNAAKQEHIR